VHYLDCAITHILVPIGGIARNRAAHARGPAIAHRRMRAEIESAIAAQCV